MAPAAIRSMVLTDFPAFDRFDGALHAMHQQARPDLFAPCKHLFTQADFEKLLASPNEIALIAEVGDRPAGICMATIKEPPAAFPPSRKGCPYRRSVCVGGIPQGRGGQGFDRVCKTGGNGKGRRAHHPDGMAFQFRRLAFL